MSQAIITKFLPATDKHDARISVRAGRGARKIIPWIDNMHLEANHEHAARCMANYLGFLNIPGKVAFLVGGELPGGEGYAYVVAYFTGGLSAC